MNTPTLIYPVAGLFLGCLVATVALVPLVMRFARRIDAVDRGGYRKVFEGAMPLLGGLAVALPLVVLGLSTSLGGVIVVRSWQWVYHEFPDQFDTLMSLSQYRGDFFVLATGAVAVLGLGLIDDTRGMRARYKLLGQLVIAAYVCGSGYSLSTVSLPIGGTLNLGVVLGSILTVFWIVGMINAFNLIDGVDGLASGIAFVGAMALVVLGLIQANYLVAFVGAALAGGLLGFLFYNFPPARMFLGDTGSMFIGYTLATMSLLGSQKSETAVILLTPILALSFPIFETLVSIIRRYLRGVPIFAGDNHHTHHRLLGKGYSQPRVVLTLYGVAVCLAVAAVLSVLIPLNSAWSGVPYALYAGALVYIAWLAGYLRPTAFRAIFERRQKNKLFHALANYAKLCLDNHGRCVERTLLLELCRHELGLRFIDVQLEDGLRLMASQNLPDHPHYQGKVETLRVKSVDDKNVFVYYAYVEPPSENHRHDVVACLAGIFNDAIIDHRGARADVTQPELNPVADADGGDMLPASEPRSS